MEACHLVSSQAAHRHPQLVPVRGEMLCPFQWAPSYHSRDYVSGTIASFSWYLDLFLRFLAPQWPCLASWPHHRTPGRWCVERMQRLHNSNLHGSDLSSGANLSEFTTHGGINIALITRLEKEGATLRKRVTRAKHRHNILISR